MERLLSTCHELNCSFFSLLVVERGLNGLNQLLALLMASLNASLLVSHSSSSDPITLKSPPDVLAALFSLLRCVRRADNLASGEGLDMMPSSGVSL